jgi:hypothetical protein
MREDAWVAVSIRHGFLTEEKSEGFCRGLSGGAFEW